MTVQDLVSLTGMLAEAADVAESWISVRSKLRWARNDLQADDAQMTRLGFTESLHPNREHMEILVQFAEFDTPVSLFEALVARIEQLEKELSSAKATS